MNDIDNFGFYSFRDYLFKRDINILYTNELPNRKENLTNLNTTLLPTGFLSKIYLIFVPGFNYSESKIHMDLIEIMSRAWIHILFIIGATVMLYFVRRGDLLSQNEFSLAYIDIMAVITGAGNIRYRYKLENIFFGFLFFGSFYINAIGIDNTFFANFLTQAPVHVDTFEKLAKLNPPIYSMGLRNDHPAIKNIKFEIYFLDSLSRTNFTFPTFSEKNLEILLRSRIGDMDLLSIRLQPQ